MNGSEILLIFVVFLLLFGADKIPGFAKAFGKGMREFKKATDDIKREITAETGDLTKDFHEIRNNLTNTINNSELVKDLHEIRQDLNNNMNNSGIANDLNEIRQNIQNTVSTAGESLQTPDHSISAPVVESHETNPASSPEVKKISVDELKYDSQRVSKDYNPLD